MIVTILHQNGDFLYNADVFRYYKAFESPDGYYIYGHYGAKNEKVYLGSYDSMKKAKKILKIIMTSLMHDKSIELPANDNEKLCDEGPTIKFEDLIIGSLG